MGIVPKHEDLLTEFKSDIEKLGDNEIVEAVVAFANTEGGMLYLGVEDDGCITGVHEKHRDVIGASAMIANRTIPSVSIRADILHEDGCDVLEISVPKSRAIVSTSEGKILRRRLKADGSPENIPMYPYEINVRLSELGALDYSSQIVRSACIEDLDPNERIRLRKIIRISKGESQLLELDDEELDKALCFVKSDGNKLYPTVAGLLMIGREDRLRELIPTAVSSFQVLEGTSVRMNEQYSKPLLATFEIFLNNMKAWNPEREISYGLLRIPVPEFSESSFREGLVNAFCHRDYTMLQSVRVAVEDEGLTISSPGTFIEGVNLSNLLTAEPHSRNPVLSDIFKRIGLAERTGRGIDRIFEGSIVFGRPLPDYSESTSSYVKLFIQRAKPDVAFARMIAAEEKRIGRPLSINSLLVLSVLQSGNASFSAIQNTVHISVPRLKAVIGSLVSSGLAEESAGRYRLSPKAYKRERETLDYLQETEMDFHRAEDMVMKLAREKGEVTRSDVISLLGIGPDQAYRILRKLVKKGFVELCGSGKGAKYRIGC